jgi:hypothetical protein
LLQFRGGRAGQIEGGDIDGVGNNRNFSGRNATGDDVSSQAFADGEDVVDLLDGPGFKLAGGAVAQAAFVGCAVVDRSIFPKCTDFIDNRDAELAGNLDGREGV